MAKVIITIEDTGEGAGLLMDASFEPKLEAKQPEDLTPAQVLAFELLETAKGMSDPESYKLRSVN